MAIIFILAFLAEQYLLLPGLRRSHLSRSQFRDSMVGLRCRMPSSRRIVRAVHGVINRRIVLTTSQVENWISPEEASARALALALSA